MLLLLVIEVYHKTEVISITKCSGRSGEMYKKYEELLKKTGKTSYQVSKDTGIAENVLSYWKTGKIKILGAQKLKILSDYFGVSIEYFLDDGQAEKEVR